MTAKQHPPGATRNKVGNGRGMKAVTRQTAKKRGLNAAKQPETISANRSKYVSLSNVPTADIAEYVDPNRPLTEKAKAFIKHWAQGHSIQAAGVLAGYNESATGYCYKVARMPQAIALYNEEKRLYQEAAQITRKDVMDMLMEAYDMAKLLSEPATMVSAAREIGKMCGFYDPIKVQVRLSGDASAQAQRMDRLSDQELLEMISQGGAQAVQQAIEQRRSDDREGSDG